MISKHSLIAGLAFCLTTGTLFAQTTPTGLTATIPGSFSVSASGAATYQIPIDLPAGAGGLTPRLSLSYNSLAGVGLAGQGWNLNGLSVITRVGKDIAHDGLAAPVTFTNHKIRWSTMETEWW